MLYTPPEPESWGHLKNILKAESVNPHHDRWMSILINKSIAVIILSLIHYSIPQAQHNCFVWCHLVLLLTSMMQCTLSSCWSWSLSQDAASAIIFLLLSTLIKTYYLTEFLPLKAIGIIPSVEAHLKFISLFCVIMQEDWMHSNKILAKSFLPFLT